MNDKGANDTLKTMNTTSTQNQWITVNKENSINRRKTLFSIKAKSSLKLEDGGDFRLLMEQQDMILSENNMFSTTGNSNSNKRPSIDLNHINTQSIQIEDDPERLFELLHKKKDITMLDHSRLVIEAAKFKSLLSDFQNKFK